MAMNIRAIFTTASGVPVVDTIIDDYDTIHAAAQVLASALNQPQGTITVRFAADGGRAVLNLRNVAAVTLKPETSPSTGGDA